MNTETFTQHSIPSSQTWLTRTIQVLIILAVPTLLVISSVRLVMMPQFLQFEYTRAGFPADYYSFTTEDRLQYGPLGIEYLLNGEDISFLSELRLPAELCYLPEPDETFCEMFTEQELQHMEDVKTVVQATFFTGVIVSMLVLFSTLYLQRSKQLRVLRRAITQGSLLTLSAIVTIIILAVIAWDFFFNTFHALFFEDGTWRFYYSDTLIRLYPEQFWFDASLTVGLITTFGALMLLALMHTLHRPTRK